MIKTFRNPILPGFYPDPSICRVGDDYYLVTSTFEYFPGLPVFHSRDLVHWRQLGHVLDRPSQLNLDGVQPSWGLYAPTIRWHAGTFYVVNTLVLGPYDRRNFIVTAMDPAGPWSEPHWLNDAPGIDPSLLLDDDGRVWYVGNRRVPDEPTPSYRQIWLQELDLAAMRLTGEKRVVWDGAVKGACCPEAPHLYRIGDLYYLLTAEGGTYHDHSVVIARSARIDGPYEPCPRNPILTHRHLGRDYPIGCTGHADLIETQAGEWWMVLLATRPIDGYTYNLGRETFLAPVRWEDGWPVVCPGAGRVDFECPAPDLPEHVWPSQPACDHFDARSLAPCWNFLRTPRERFWSLDERPGHLRLRLRPAALSELANPSFIGRRQQHLAFAARTCLEFEPRGAHECAGLVLLQNNDFHFRLVVAQASDGSAEARLVQRRAGREQVLGTQPARGARIWLKIEARGQDYSFYAADQAEAWRPIAERVDGSVLSTTVAGGFTGAYIGLYASSNGQPSNNGADFDWFEYQGLSG
jgi:alpha-N-arabinofuranosidase